MIVLPAGDSNEERRAIACSSVKVQTAAPVGGRTLLRVRLTRDMPNRASTDGVVRNLALVA
jgi:hypothetical protein